MARWLWRQSPRTANIRAMATVAVVLPGGGARGAYEVGALSVLLPALEQRGERVAIWCGTSVGAINATALASLAHLPVSEQVSQTLALWRSMRKQDVISPIAGPGGVRILTRLVKHALGIRGAALASLLDPSPLAGSLDQWIDWSQLQTNVRRGEVEAACVVATSLETGDPVAFVSAANGAPTHSDDTIRYVKARIQGEHVRASAAIPLLFPAVEVRTPRAARGHYIDGGTRLNSPIKPALNLGADKVIVVGLEPFAAARSAAHQNGNGNTPHRRAPAANHVPGIADVAANMLDGLLVDQVAYDLRRLAAINTFFAEDAVTGTSRAARAYRVARGHKPYRPISYALVAPRRRGDIGRLADAVFERRYGGPRGLRDLDFALISRVLGGRSRSRGEFLSFLLFDEQFVSELVVMGRRDATRWLRRHPGFWCRDADHDLSVDRLDRSLVSEQQVLEEFRALRRR
jgi:NTE family protein